MGALAGDVALMTAGLVKVLVVRSTKDNGRRRSEEEKGLASVRLIAHPRSNVENMIYRHYKGIEP